MQIEIESGQIDISEAFRRHIIDSLDGVERRWGDRLTRVTMYMQDINSATKGGVDKRCTLEARPAGSDPIVVENVADDAYVAVKGAVDKLGRALANALDRTARQSR